MAAKKSDPDAKARSTPSLGSLLNGKGKSDMKGLPVESIAENLRNGEKTEKESIYTNGWGVKNVPKIDYGNGFERSTKQTNKQKDASDDFNSKRRGY